jgi:hypothetical protein
MKNLNINTVGGFRAFSDDFLFMQTADKEALEMLVKPLSEQYPVFILYGCNISSAGGNTTVTDGAIVMNGEILKFNEVIIPAPVNPNFAYWIVQTETLASRNFQDGSSVDVHQEKIGAVEVSDSLPSGTLKISETLRYFDIITNSLVKPEWQTLPESVNDFPTTGPAARFLKDNSGMVHLGGFFTEDDPAGLTHIGRLPVGYRPAEDIEVLNISRTDSNTGVFHRYKIKTDGFIEPLDSILQTVNFNNWPSFKAVEV